MFSSHSVFLPITINLNSFLGFVSEISYNIQVNMYVLFFFFKTSSSILYIIFLKLLFQFNR